MNRACEFGAAFRDYMAAAADQLLGIVQIESPSAVRQADEIAALDGVDVLFVGPSDLSHSMGIFGQTEHPFFLNALTAVAEAAQKAGKACGILLRNPEETQRFLSLGYTFLACGSDASLLRGAAQKQLAALREAAALSSAVNSSATGVISR
jgi:2-keto-3-deoxy-L-rhamnonate aldolase RhmA